MRRLQIVKVLITVIVVASLLQGCALDSIAGNKIPYKLAPHDVMPVVENEDLEEMEKDTNASPQP